MAKYLKEINRNSLLYSTNIWMIKNYKMNKFNAQMKDNFHQKNIKTVEWKPD